MHVLRWLAATDSPYPEVHEEIGRAPNLGDPAMVTELLAKSLQASYARAECEQILQNMAVSGRLL